MAKLKKHYYCNNCNRNHYSSSNIYQKHIKSANTGVKNIENTRKEIKKIKDALRNKEYKEIIIFKGESGLTAIKCNACNKVKFKGDFYLIGNERLICKHCEAKIGLIQYRNL